MSQNSAKLLFLMTLLSGTTICICANSWMSAWMGLEINLLSFIPLMSSSQNMYSNEASLKYFLIQAIASSTLLFLLLLKINVFEMFYSMSFTFWNNLLIPPLLMKIASAPFHWWLPSVIEGLSWMNSFIILSIQKIAPLILTSYLLTNSILIQGVIISSALFGALGGFNQISLRKILSFSSINHIGWMLAAMTTGLNSWFLYFLIYIINLSTIILILSSTTLSFIPQTFNCINNLKLMKITLFIAMLSLGGLPPFLGFFPKWIIIHSMIQNFMTISCLILVFSSLLTLFYYMRIMYAALVVTNSEISWLTSHLDNYPNPSKLLLLSLSVTILGMLACTSIVLNF
uniref:NADH-ubiquinone oxidoreductase chain 2 n=1 Tax=Theopompa sp. FY-2016a TaxID=1849000 RepID=A0A172QHI4_9NEOP|nr:NADH dehydrogenase subunit 2 [Theopompa sp. FY-2016a]